jgi:hypothetical protein
VGKRALPWTCGGRFFEERNRSADTASMNRAAVVHFELKATSWRAEFEERDRLLIALGYSRYSDYLASHHWQEVRARIRLRAAGSCEVCSCSAALQVHHLTYATLGQEGDNDLLAVCETCHEVAHLRDTRRRRSKPDRAGRIVGGSCSVCDSALSSAHVWYCRKHSASFDGHLYCMSHRPSVAEIDQRLFVRWLRNGNRAQRSVAVLMHGLVLVVAVGLGTLPIWGAVLLILSVT